MSSSHCRHIPSILILYCSSFRVYNTILTPVLWAEVFNFYTINKEIIIEGDAFLNNTFVMFGITDATGYLKDIDLTIFYDTIGAKNPQVRENIFKVIDKLEPKIIKFSFFDRFISLTTERLPLNKNIVLDELTSAGFALFWLALRNVFIGQPQYEIVFKDNVDLNNVDEYLNFLVGVQMQNWDNQYLILRNKIVPVLYNLYNIIYIEEINNEIVAYFIADIFIEDQQPNFNNRVMSVVEALRKLYINVEKYNVEMIGHNIIDGVQLPDAEKHIPKENLPFAWITLLNGWLNRLHDYMYMPETWDEVTTKIFETRQKIILAIDSIIIGVDYLYRKSDIKKLVSDRAESAVNTVLKATKNSPAKYPQCALDKYGIRLDNAVVDISSNNLSMNESKSDENKHFQRVFNGYCSSINNFFMQKDELLR